MKNHKSLNHIFNHYYVHPFDSTSLRRVARGMENLVGSSLIDADGNNHSSQVLYGKIIGLNFSAGWCPLVTPLARNTGI